MVGPRLRGVKAAAGLWLLLAVVGCFAHRYPRLVVTHAELLADMAEKGRDLVVAGRFTAESLPELTYPLERATVYEAEARRQFGAAVPTSLAAFTGLVAEYQAFVRTLDDLRRQPPDQRDVTRPTLDAAVASLRRRADEVRIAATGGR